MLLLHNKPLFILHIREAMRVERHIKKLTREEKEKLIKFPERLLKEDD